MRMRGQHQPSPRLCPPEIPACAAQLLGVALFPISHYPLHVQCFQQLMSANSHIQGGNVYVQSHNSSSAGRGYMYRWEVQARGRAREGARAGQAGVLLSEVGSWRQEAWRLRGREGALSVFLRFPMPEEASFQSSETVVADLKSLEEAGSQPLGASQGFSALLDLGSSRNGGVEAWRLSPSSSF